MHLHNWCVWENQFIFIFCKNTAIEYLSVKHQTGRYNLCFYKAICFTHTKAYCLSNITTTQQNYIYTYNKAVFIQDSYTVITMIFPLETVRVRFFFTECLSPGKSISAEINCLKEKERVVATLFTVQYSTVLQKYYKALSHCNQSQSIILMKSQRKTKNICHPICATET